jgi:hypothetical protein
MARWPVQAVLWVLAVGVLLLLARWRGVFGVVVQLSVGLLLTCGGIGFVLAPLLRRQAGRPIPGDERPTSRGSFRIGLVVTIAGLAVTGVALWHLGSVVGAHAVRTLAP